MDTSPIRRSLDLRRLPEDWSEADVALLQAVDDATATPIDITYGRSQEWFDGIGCVIDDLEQALGSRPSIVLALLEHLLRRLDAAMDRLDDSDGGLVEAIAGIVPLHAAAATATGLTQSDLDQRRAELDHLELRPFEGFD